MPFRYSQVDSSFVLKVVTCIFQSCNYNNILRVEIYVQLLKIGGFVWNLIHVDMQLYI